MPTLSNTSVWQDIGSGTALTKTFGFTPADGSSMVLLIMLGDTARSVTSITGFTVGGTVANVNNFKYEVWIRNGVTGSPTTATINLDGSTFASCAAFNYAGDVSFVQLTAKTIYNTDAMSDPITASANSSVILTAALNVARNWSSPIPSGFAILDGVSTALDSVYDADIGAGGTINVGCTLSAGIYHEISILELSGSGGGGPTLDPITSCYPIGSI